MVRFTHPTGDAMDNDVIILGLAWYLVFLFSLTIHEAGHALAALKLGDPTAYFGGQVTLNPRPHIQREPVGMVLVPLLTYFTQGWMMGWAHIPLNPYWALNYPRRASIVAAAGPAANLLLVLVSALGIRAGVMAGVFEAPHEVMTTRVVVATAEQGAAGLEGLRLGGLTAAVALLLSITFSLNLLLFVFNLIPFPPLDGSSVILLFLGEENARKFWLMVHQPGMSLAGLVMAWMVFPQIYGPVHTWALNLLYPGAGYQAL